MGIVFLVEVDDLELRRSLEQEVAYGPGRAAERDLERRLPLSSATGPACPSSCSAATADALDVAQAKAERGIDARAMNLYPRRPVHVVPPLSDGDDTRT